jgi:phospholipid/cholesterol/gamma-HCH transport system substrate-binding protein
MPDQAKNMLIGIFVVAACAIIVFLLMFLHPSVGDEARLLRVRFADIDKISIGTRVSFAGKPVGEVIEIRELPDVDVERKAINGYVYVYELTLRVDSGVSVFNTDEIASRTSGLLGEKSVAITPGIPKSGEALYLVNDEIIYASETGSVEDTFKTIKNLADKIETTVDGFNDVLASLKTNKFWDNLGETASNINSITTSLNNPEILSSMLSNAHQFTVDLKNSWPKLEKIIDNFSATSTNAQLITERIHKGEGSIGKIITNDDLYLRLTSLLSKADTTMNDINHYGILFHLDKHWQRLRARRMNLFQKLSTPQEFRNYFNDELDQINTSISRVSMVLGQYEFQPPYCCYNLLLNPEYTKVFAELMRKISGLEEEVRLYNEQVIDKADKETEFVDYFECFN